MNKVMISLHDIRCTHIQIKTVLPIFGALVHFWWIVPEGKCMSIREFTLNLLSAGVGKN